MNKTPILKIEPKELKFIFELKKQSSCSVQMTNNTHHHVAFKIKTTSPRKYCVRPHVGVLPPKSTCEFIVTKQAEKVAPEGMVCKDKFLIQSTLVPAETTRENVSSWFVKDGKRYVEENKLKVALISPPDSREVAPVNGDYKNRQFHHEKVQIYSKAEIQSPVPMVLTSTISVTISGVIMNKTPILEIEPKELKFIFELMKQSSCSIQLTNNTNHHVAFKIKTTSPRKYCVRPNVGVLAPKSTCEFITTMQAQEVAPEEMVCKDKFLIQSTLVPAETTREDVFAISFVKDGTRYVEEKKLKVALISPPDSPEIAHVNGNSKNQPSLLVSFLESLFGNGSLSKTEDDILKKISRRWR